MAKISNTTVYPNVIPAGDDLIILTDVSDDGSTKNTTVEDLRSYFSSSIARVTITPSQVLNSFTTPVVLVPAQGPNKYVIPYGIAVVRNVYNASPFVPYNITSDPIITYDGTIFGFIDHERLDSVNNNAGWVNIEGSSAGNLEEDFPLVFRCQSLNPTVGNGDIVIDIQYRIVEIA